MSKSRKHYTNNEKGTKLAWYFSSKSTSRTAEASESQKSLWPTFDKELFYIGMFERRVKTPHEEGSLYPSLNVTIARHNEPTRKSMSCCL